jgi:hypothetical protein
MFDDISKERRQLLQDKYEFLKPTLLTEGLMAFGFDCGDGWLPILEDLCDKIDEELKKSALIGFKVVQIKEKFGTLRFYVQDGNKVINELINAASKKAAITCEDCGKPGRRRTLNAGKFHGWVRTQCDGCFTLSTQK